MYKSIKYIKRWINNIIEMLYLLFGFIAGIIGALFSIIIRVELAYPGVQILDNNWQFHINILYMRRSIEVQPSNLPKYGINVQYTKDKSIFEVSKFHIGYIHGLNNKNFSYLYNDMGLNKYKKEIEKSKLIDSFNFNLYKTIKHPLVYVINEIDDTYLDLICTNMTTTNKSVSLNYLNKQIQFNVQSINKEDRFQGILKGCFIFRLRRDDNSYYIYNLDDLNNPKNIEFIEKKLGGIEYVNKIKIVSSNILQNREIPKIDYYHEFSNIVNIAYDQLIFYSSKDE